MKPSDKTRLLQAIAAIPAMEPGKLSAFSIPGRSAAAGPYHKLQHWRDGKNHTRHVPAGELAAVQAAAADLGKKETPAPVCRKRPRKDFRGQQTQLKPFVFRLQA